MIFYFKNHKLKTETVYKGFIGTLGRVLNRMVFLHRVE